MFRRRVRVEVAAPGTSSPRPRNDYDVNDDDDDDDIIKQQQKKVRLSMMRISNSGPLLIKMTVLWIVIVVFGSDSKLFFVSLLAQQQQQNDDSSTAKASNDGIRMAANNRIIIPQQQAAATTAAMITTTTTARSRMVHYDSETRNVTAVLSSPGGHNHRNHRRQHSAIMVDTAHDDDDKGSEDDDESESSSDDDDDGTCQPMDEWQSKSYVVCNTLQEYDMLDATIHNNMQFINCGGERCAFQINDSTHNEITETSSEKALVFKIPKIYKPFDEYKFECARRDGMAMERLTASPYVLTTYGYCGMSQIIEHGNGGNVHDLVKRARLQGSTKEQLGDGLTIKTYADTLENPIDKLKVAIQLVTGVADMHDVGIVHNDICCHQYILVDGVYKLNDFHLSKFLRRNQETQDVCLEERAIGKSWLLIHSPEEIMSRVVDPVKADDYVIGNVLYYVLTSKWIMEDEPKPTRDQRTNFIANGQRSFIPPRIQNSNHPADIALIEAIHMCWTQNLQKRPTSRQVSNYLHEKLREILQKEEGTPGAVVVSDPVRVSSIPPLPDDWNYGERDFRRNFH